MAARSFKEVQERMGKMQCIVILDNERILAYFWIAQRFGEAAESSVAEPEVIIDYWGVNEDLLSEQLKEECITAMLKLLHNKGLIKHGVMLS